MTSADPVVVVGGGVGGLMAAIRLRSLGHEVVVYERRQEWGGKLTTLERDGYVFDIGPSLVTLPDILDDALATVGRRLADELDLVRLDPQFHYHWSDGSSLVIADDAERTRAALESFSPGAGADWQRFIERGRRIWEISRRTFFAGPMRNPLQLIRRMRSPTDLWHIDPMRTLDQVARRTFDDRRLQQWVGRYATYSGSSPYRAPATLACIPAIESDHGCWYPKGGLGAIRDMLERIAGEVGIEMHLGAEITSITTHGDRVSGIALANGGQRAASTVVVNADAEHLYRDLLDDAGALRRVRRADRSTSGFVICAGLPATTATTSTVMTSTGPIGHHNVWFSDDYRQEFADLEAGRFPEQPTVYACVSSVTDRTQAPDGAENWFLLVNTPAGLTLDRQQATEIVLRRLAEFDIDVAGRAAFIETVTPDDLAERYRSPGGAIYGTSSNGRRAAFARPGNVGARRGLYLVGGSSHPGGGLPLVTLSAEIVARMIGRPA